MTDKGALGARDKKAYQSSKVEARQIASAGRGKDELGIPEGVAFQSSRVRARWPATDVTGEEKRENAFLLSER